MQPVKARITRGLPVGSYVDTCDNSGAKLLKIFTVYGQKSVKGRRTSAGVGDIDINIVVLLYILIVDGVPKGKYLA